MKDHGAWVRYHPVPPLEGSFPGVMYAKRVSDGVDWYDYVKGDNFAKTSIKLTVRAWQKGGPVLVSAPQVEAAHLFPADHRVIELEGDFSGLDEAARIQRFAGRVINLETGDLTDRPQPSDPPSDAETKILDALEKITARLEALEGKG